MMSKVPLCEHGIIIGSINPCEECNKAVCPECGGMFSKTVFVICASCLTKVDQSNKESKERLLGHIPYVRSS